MQVSQNKLSNNKFELTAGHSPNARVIWGYLLSIEMFSKNTRLYFIYKFIFYRIIFFKYKI